MLARVCVCVVGVILAFWAAPATAGDVKVYPIGSYLDCNKTCAVTLFAGPLLQINLTPEDSAHSTLVGGTLSRVLVAFGQDATIEGEVGFAQRFGDMDEREVWAAATFRWKSFPWNRYLVTTLALSEGVDYASDVASYEITQSKVGHGARLLNYLAPELTLALPDYPDWQLLFSVHHRSGGGILWRDHGPFDGVWGASQYFVMGVRHWF